MMKKFKEMWSNIQERRLIIVIVAAIVFAAVVAGIILQFTGPSNTKVDEEVNSTVKIDNQERVQVEDLSDQAIKDFGTFGSVKDNLTGDNIGNVSYMVEAAPLQASDYWVPRSTQYSGFKDSYIADDSPLDYDTQIISQWANAWEPANLVGYSVTSVESIAQDNAGKVTINDKEYKAVYVDVTFSSQETQYMATGSDTEWDGSYNVMQKGFSDNTATLTFVEISDNNWKMYSIRDLDNQFLLSTWETPASDAYSETQFDFETVATLTPSAVSTTPGDMPPTEQTANDNSDGE